MICKTDAYLDDAGGITTTVTQVITQVDQLIVTFHWNPALRWSDGQPVTADDLVFAYEAAKANPLSPEIAGPAGPASGLRARRRAHHPRHAAARPDHPSLFPDLLDAAAAPLAKEHAARRDLRRRVRA